MDATKIYFKNHVIVYMNFYIVFKLCAHTDIINNIFYSNGNVVWINNL